MAEKWKKILVYVKERTISQNQFDSWTATPILVNNRKGKRNDDSLESPVHIPEFMELSRVVEKNILEFLKQYSEEFN